MARGRLISKSLGSSRKFHALLKVGGKLGEFCQVLFPLLVASSDDFGRLPGDAFTVKNVVLPSSRRREADFDRALDVIAEVGLIDRYEVNGDNYIQINKFDDHQVNLHKRRESSFPESPGTSGKDRPNLTESNLTESKRTHVRVGVSDGFAEFWQAYPKKKAKDAAQKAWGKRRPNSDLLAVMLRALERQTSSPDWHKDSGRYIPFPATWLNRGQWTDEDTETAPDTPDRYGHLPPCRTMAECRDRALREAAAARTDHE